MAVFQSRRQGVFQSAPANKGGRNARLTPEQQAQALVSIRTRQ